MVMSEKESLAPKRPEPPPSSPLADQTLYHDSTQTPRAVSSNSSFEGCSIKHFERKDLGQFPIQSAQILTACG